MKNKDLRIAEWHVPWDDLEGRSGRQETADNYSKRREPLKSIYCYHFAWIEFTVEDSIIDVDIRFKAVFNFLIIWTIRKSMWSDWDFLSRQNYVK